MPVILATSGLVVSRGCTSYMGHDYVPTISTITWSTKRKTWEKRRRRFVFLLNFVTNSSLIRIVDKTQCIFGVFQGESGAATNYVSRNQAIKKLQLSLPDFRLVVCLQCYFSYHTYGFSPYFIFHLTKELLTNFLLMYIMNWTSKKEY